MKTLILTQPMDTSKAELYSNPKDEIGRKQIELLLLVGEYLAEEGNTARTVLFNELGMTRSDLTKATTLHLFPKAVKTCDTVVKALQLCSVERDKLRYKANKTTAPKPLSAEELAAKQAKDSKENEEYNEHRAMTSL